MFHTLFSCASCIMAIDEICHSCLSSVENFWSRFASKTTSGAARLQETPFHLPEIEFITGRAGGGGASGQGGGGEGREGGVRGGHWFINGKSTSGQSYCNVRMQVRQMGLSGFSTLEIVIHACFQIAFLTPTGLLPADL